MHTYVECPRDAWQGMTRFIPTQAKIGFLTALLEAGFTHLDCGSFVSPKAVPQMSDTEAVLEALPSTSADLLCIVANQQGLARAKACGRVTSVGYPLSISDTFQRRNTNRSLEDSWNLVEEMYSSTNHLRLVVYLSMGFGNPYGDVWDINLVLESVARLRQIGVEHIVLADTYGQADAARVEAVVSAVVQQFGAAGIGVHLHAHPDAALQLAQAALNAGALWLEGALGGMGGCPFAGDSLVGNLPTEVVLPMLQTKVNLEHLALLQRHALEVLRI
ncbi:MAG: hydroxymethylglutaryl-CoA lyase [Deinococcales bacterium]